MSSAAPLPFAVVPLLALLDQPVSVAHYMVVGAVLFAAGLVCMAVKRNALGVLMGIELVLNGANINFVAFSSFLGDLVGQVFTMFVLTVAAAEAAIGLAILVCFFRNRGTIDVEDVNVMKG
jgi:NADH-quinone oxidoreductase subunit K